MHLIDCWMEIDSTVKHDIFVWLLDFACKAEMFSIAEG